MSLFVYFRTALLPCNLYLLSKKVIIVGRSQEWRASKWAWRRGQPRWAMTPVWLTLRPSQVRPMLSLLLSLVAGSHSCHYSPLASDELLCVSSVSVWLFVYVLPDQGNNNNQDQVGYQCLWYVTVLPGPGAEDRTCDLWLSRVWWASCSDRQTARGDRKPADIDSNM